ncbi:MAG: formate/nitrite transporter family protein [Clostridia bacterium]
MKILKTIISGVLAGICIAIGGCASLSLDSKIAGGIFFTVGLFLVVTYGFKLYTGMVGNIVSEKKTYIFTALLALIGNLIGAFSVGFLVRLTRLTPLIEKAEALAAAKFSDGFLSIFILAVFCNILIYFAVDTYKNNKHELGKYLGLLLCVPVFIICSFDHCVANMFYLAAGNAYSLHSFFALLIMILGNTVGGLIIPLCRLLLREKGETGN